MMSRLDQAGHWVRFPALALKPSVTQPITKTHGYSASSCLRRHPRSHKIRRAEVSMSQTATRTALGPESSSTTRPLLRVLLMEDNPADRDLILRELGKDEFEIISEVVQTVEGFRQQVRTNCPDVVLSDYNLGQWRGTEALEILGAEGLDIPFILVSASLGAVTAVECLKQGAADYVLKDSLARLPVGVCAGSVMSAPMTRAPSVRSRFAVAQPIPDAAPVTI